MPSPPEQMTGENPDSGPASTPVINGLINLTKISAERIMHDGRFMMKNRIIAFIKSKYSLGRDKTIQGYNRLEEKIITQVNIYRTRFNALTPVKQNRTIVLVLSLVLVADYLMICLHTGRNPIDIFPSIPVLDMRDEITVYVPSPEGKMLKETRLVDISDDEELYAKRLVHFVTSGSAFENTRIMTPIQGNVRKIWISEEHVSLTSGLKPSMTTLRSPPAPKISIMKRLLKRLQRTSRA